MLVEAIEIFELLWTKGYHSDRGEYCTVEDAQIFDLPDQPISELPNPINFDADARTVRTVDLAEMIPHGPDPEPYAAVVKKWEAAGFDKLAFVQVGDDQHGFFEFWTKELAPVL